MRLPPKKASTINKRTNVISYVRRAQHMLAACHECGDVVAKDYFDTFAEISTKSCSTMPRGPYGLLEKCENSGGFPVS